MSDETNENSLEDTTASIWQNGKSVGTLASSTSNMSQVRKDIIKFALTHEIKDIRTYSGYKGDLLVEIMATDLDVLHTIGDWANNLGMETVLKENPMTMIHALFCITPDEDVYALVEPK